MLVINTSTGSYAQDPVKYLGFEKYKDICDNIIFIKGQCLQKNGLTDLKIPKRISTDKKIIRLELEEPNKYLIHDKPYEYDKLFDKVFTICPYTAEWINKMHKNTKRTATFFPFNEDFIPTTRGKKYDIIYTGHIICPQLYKDIEIIKRYNYRFVSNSGDPLVTNRGISYKEKLKLISQSKITLVHNLLYLNRLYALNLWRIPNFKKNKAFKDIPGVFNFPSLLLKKDFFVPQIKSRTFEAAFCKSLILCRKDNFNIIEKFFTPNKEFVYFDQKNLEGTINKILNNYPSYQKIIDNAYKKAVNNYTTKQFVKKYLMTQ